MPRRENVISAQRLLGAAQSSAGADLVGNAGQLLLALYQSLGPVVGAAGVGATFARSVKLNKLASSCLDATANAGLRQPSQTELLALLTQCLHSVDPAAAAGLAVDVYATFFDLMSNFIGDDLLWQIVKRPPLVPEETGTEEQTDG